MPQGDEQQFVAFDIEAVDNSVVTNAQPILRTPSQSLMGKALQPPTQIPNVSLDPPLQRSGQQPKTRVELARVDLGGLAHRPSGLADSHPPFL